MMCRILMCDEYKMTDAEKKRLIEIWNKDGDLLPEEIRGLYGLIYKALEGWLPGKCFSLIQSLNTYQKKQDLIHDFICEKLVFGNRGKLERFEALYNPFFYRYLVGKWRIFEPITKKEWSVDDSDDPDAEIDKIINFTSDKGPWDKSDPVRQIISSDDPWEPPAIKTGNLHKIVEVTNKEHWCWDEDDQAWIDQTLDCAGLTFEIVADKARVFLREKCEPWAKLYLRLHDCCPKKLEDHENEEYKTRGELAGIWNIRSYQRRAGQLGVVVPGEMRLNDSVFCKHWGEKTLIGAWLKDEIGLELTYENSLSILACLKILCKVTLDRVDAQGDLR